MNDSEIIIAPESNIDLLFRNAEAVIASYLHNKVQSGELFSLLDKIVKYLMNSSGVDKVLTEALIKNADALSLRMVQTKAYVCVQGNEPYSSLLDMEAAAKDSPKLVKFSSFTAIFYGNNCRTINKLLRSIDQSKESFFYSVVTRELHRFTFKCILTTPDIKENIIDSVRGIFDQVFAVDCYPKLKIGSIIHMVKIAIFLLNKDNSMLLGFNNMGDNNYTLEFMKTRQISEDEFGYLYPNSSKICAKTDFFG